MEKHNPKIIPPRISGALKPMENLSAVLAEDEDALEGYSCADQMVTDHKKEHISFQSCVFSNCRFPGCSFKGCQFSDVVFKNCDLSNISFSGSSFFRVEFVECKFTGADFSRSMLNQVTFQECKGTYSLFSMGKFRHVRYSRSDMQGAALSNCQFLEVEIEACRLIDTEFYATSLKGMDLSDSEIAGIRLTVPDRNELRGAVITSLQAVELVQLLGVIVKD